MGIVFQSDIGEASPIIRLGFFAGIICDEARYIFHHLARNVL
jgi:hypothetical protein